MLPHMSSFVLQHMASLIRTWVRTNKGFKEVHLTACAKALFEYCGAEVTSTQVYNHLRNWGLRWIQVSKLRDLSGAGWCEETYTIILQEAHYVGHVSAGHRQTCHGLRKRGALGDDEIQAFSSMTEAVKEVSAAIRENKPTDLHPDLYVAVMDTVGFTEEALMLALCHLIDHKAQGVNFVGMAEQHRTLWLRTFLGKYYKD
ncbi:unnamed protein product [Alopecurus aequalis]